LTTFSIIEWRMEWILDVDIQCNENNNENYTFNKIESILESDI